MLGIQVSTASQLKADQTSVKTIIEQRILDIDFGGYRLMVQRR